MSKEISSSKQYVYLGYCRHELVCVDFVERANDESALSGVLGWFELVGPVFGFNSVQIWDATEQCFVCGVDFEV